MDQILTIELDANETIELRRLTRSLTERFRSIDDPDFAGHISAFVDLVPPSLREKMAFFRKGCREPVCIVEGYPMDEGELPPTPDHWNEVKEPNAPGDYYLMLMSSLLGDVFGFSNLQGGKLVQEIFPIREDRSKQLGTGAVELYLHTEDSSLEYRADFLGFFCNRNLDKIATQVAAPDLGKISENSIHVLRDSSFKIYNDREAFDDRERKEQFAVCSVLYAHGEHLGMRFDPLYMDQDALTDEQRSAIGELIAEVEASVFPVNLSPGAIAFIDNHRCAHGRGEFQPRYDGTDRWLKRTQISMRLGMFSDLTLPGRIQVLP
jgi:L-asparagine oxygenase